MVPEVVQIDRLDDRGGAPENSQPKHGDERYARPTVDVEVPEQRYWDDYCEEDVGGNIQCRVSISQALDDMLRPAGAPDAAVPRRGWIAALEYYSLRHEFGQQCEFIV